MSVTSRKWNKSQRKILNSNNPRIDPSGTPCNNSRHELNASIFTKYYTNILLYYILYTFMTYFFTKLISTFIRRRSTNWFYYQGSYIEHKQKLWLETPGALLEVTTPNAADCLCHAYKNLGGRKHIRSTKNFWRTPPYQSL